MRVQLKGTHTSLTPSIKVYIDEKLVRSVSKLFGNKESDHFLEIEFERTTRHHHKGKIWRAEANLTFGKKMIRAEAFGEDPREAIDILEEELKREVKTFKEKSTTRERRGARKIKKILRRPT